jgi:hypothetical protein
VSSDERQRKANHFVVSITRCARFRQKAGKSTKIKTKFQSLPTEVSAEKQKFYYTSELMEQKEHETN